MKVFISHVFGGDDELLAAALKGDLDAAGLDGYMAEKTKRYELLIHDKIRQEIEESEWLVAIITKRSHRSPSVHEEIGYALGRGVRVALMVEKGVKEGGVLIYGQEQEVFAPDEFSASSKRVAEAIGRAPRAGPRRDRLGEEARTFLEKRCLLNDESPDFAKNKRFDSLYSGSLTDAEKPVVLFTACPHELVDHYDVTSHEFREWVESNTRVEVDGHGIHIPGIDTDVDIGMLRIVEKRDGIRDKNIILYREYRSNGFLEWGTSSMFFSRNDKGEAKLHLCYMIGLFWAFLASARAFYKKIGLDAPLAVLVSIRNSRGMGLGNYGDKEDGHMRGSIDLTTNRPHIRLPYPLSSAAAMTDKDMADLAMQTAKHVCNAYGETIPNCYDADGSFSWGRYRDVSHVTGGYHL